MLFGLGSGLFADGSGLEVAPPFANTEAAGKSIQVKPVLKPESKSIQAGDKKLTVRADGSMEIVASGQKLADITVAISTTGTRIPFHDRPKLTQKTAIRYDAEKKEFVCDVPFLLDARGRYAVNTRRISLTGEGLVNVKVSFTFPQGGEDELKIQRALIFLTAPNYLGKAVRIRATSKNGRPDNRDFTLTKKSGFALTAKKYLVDYNPETPVFNIKFIAGDGYIQSAYRADRDKIQIEAKAADKKQLTYEYNIDLRSVPEKAAASKSLQAGIDFWSSDRLIVPDYRKSRNLVQNPSFEAGMRYYTYHAWNDNFQQRTRPFFEIDEKEARSGRRSLKLNTFRKEESTQISGVKTFAIPVYAGKKYTVSFYAKGKGAPRLFLKQRCISAVWLQFPKQPVFEVTGEWKRYSYTLTAPNRGLTFLFYAEDAGKGTGSIWLDDLQVEEGEKATEFTAPPVIAELCTSAPGNFIESKTGKLNAELKIFAAPGTEGTVSCSLEDFPGNRPWKGEFQFKTDAEGLATAALPLDKAVTNGLYVLRTDFKLKNGYCATDFFRIAKLKFLDNTHRNKNIFGAGMPQCGSFDLRKVLERSKHCGFGSTRQFTGAPAGFQPHVDRMEEENGIETVYHSLQLTHLEGLTQKFLRNIRKMTPEIEKTVEDSSYQAAKKHPHAEKWCLISEAEWACPLVRDSNYADYARLLIASYKGIKRANPAKKVFLGGSCNMEPRTGTRFVDEYLTAVAKADKTVKFDGVTIHPYRTTPENPDLDSDAKVFFDMLDRHGYKDVPVYWEEGIFYPCFNIPEWGLTPHKGCSSNHARMGAVSYHMGWGERMSAAYSARSWLVALKYQDRVKMFIEMSNEGALDSDLTPYARQLVPNTLGNLLGDAVFRKDIRFAPDTRSYVFEDGRNRPVAVVWSHDPRVDRGFAESPVGEFDFKGLKFEVFDLMGAKRTVEPDSGGRCLIPVTPFPMFIRSAPGTLDALCKVIQNVRLRGTEKAAIGVSAKPLDGSTLRLQFLNRLTRPFDGTAAVGKQKKALKLGARESKTMDIAMPDGISDGKISTVDIPVTLTEKDRKQSVLLKFDIFTVRKVKGKPDWNAIASIPVKNRNIVKTDGGVQLKEPVGYPGDFEASFKMAWNDDFLYLKVDVVDDKFVHVTENLRSVGSRYYNDSLQIYIDTLCDARDKATRGFDGNDYNYDFYPEKDGSVTAYRRYAPEIQAAGGLFAPLPDMVEPGIKGTFKRTEKGYSYDIAIPKFLVNPFALKKGNCCGFAIYLNDRDGARVKSGLSLTPPGTGGFRNPHLYPVLLLTE